MSLKGSILKWLIAAGKSIRQWCYDRGPITLFLTHKRRHKCTCMYFWITDHSFHIFTTQVVSGFSLSVAIHGINSGWLVLRVLGGAGECPGRWQRPPVEPAAEETCDPPLAQVQQGEVSPPTVTHGTWKRWNIARFLHGFFHSEEMILRVGGKLGAFLEQLPLWVLHAWVPVRYFFVIYSWWSVLESD